VEALDDMSFVRDQVQVGLLSLIYYFLFIFIYYYVDAYWPYRKLSIQQKQFVRFNTSK